MSPIQASPGSGPDIKHSIETSKMPVEEDDVSLQQNPQRTDQQTKDLLFSPRAALNNFVLNWLDYNAGRPSRHYFTKGPESSTPTALLPRPQSLPAMNRHHGDHEETFAPAAPSSTGSSRGRRQSAEGPIPSSASLPSRESSSRASSSPRGRSLVELHNYRLNHLRSNGIEIELDWDNVPLATRAFAESMMTRRRSSPEPSRETVAATQSFRKMIIGCDEAAVASYLSSNVLFPEGHHAKMEVSSNMLIHCDWVPSLSPKNRISQPKPDSLYGYAAQSFQSQHMLRMESMHRNLLANSQNLVLPFLSVEYKSEGPSSNGSLWVAENQCFGASAACNNMVSHLNDALAAVSRHPGPIGRLEGAVFSIAMSNRVVILYVSWLSAPQTFSSAHMKTYLVRDHHHFLEFRRTVRNIVDWGMGERLQCVYDCLDVLVEEERLKNQD